MSDTFNFWPRGHNPSSYSQGIATSHDAVASASKDLAEIALRRQAPPDSQRLQRVIIITLIAFGVLVRLVQYLSNRSLWLDEAMLSLNFLHRSASQLLQPLEYSQGAAPVFLWLERLAVRTLGPSEYSLRLLPFLAGVSSIFVFYAVARKWVSQTATLVALFLFVISAPLIYYSTQAKQYSMDVLAALLLYAVVTAVKSQPSFTEAVLLGIAGAIGIWFSHPAVFVFAGVCITLFFFYVVMRNRAAAINIVFAASLGLLSFVILYWVSLRHLTGDRNLRISHWGNFAPLPFSADAINWYYETFLTVFERSAGLGAAALAAFTLLVGIISTYKKSKRQVCFLLSPILIALVASGLHRYPFTDRFLLFAVPALLMLLAEGVVETGCLLRPHLPAAGFLLLGLMALQPFMHAVTILFHPETVEEIRPVLDYVQAHQQPGDIIYVYYGAVPAFDYYSEISRFRPDGRVVNGTEGRADWRIYEHELIAFRGHHRVWMIFSHVWTGGPGGERVWYVNNGGVSEERLLSYDLDAIGERIDSFRAPGASAYLYDMGDTSTPR